MPLPMPLQDRSQRCGVVNQPTDLYNNDRSFPLTRSLRISKIVKNRCQRIDTEIGTDFPEISFDVRGIIFSYYFELV